MQRSVLCVVVLRHFQPLLNLHFLCRWYFSLNQSHGDSLSAAPPGFTRTHKPLSSCKALGILHDFVLFYAIFVLSPLQLLLPKWLSSDGEIVGELRAIILRRQNCGNLQ